ncbi:ead/Ea22-like family protein [Citrobacter freundii]|uniref:ead/Ea22-like family protein n=1 Tax=Citrobacter freundii TaxID=546 RepID=UPI0018C4BF1B|nr:ead/Ea22-like family protein [Citrobacter freundii]
MTALNKQALRKLAKALSGKEWVAFVHKASGTYAVGSLGHERGEDIIKWPGFDGQDNAESKAKFIAAASPATVLALLDELEAAESYAKDRDEENQDLMLTIGRLRVEREASEAELNDALCELLPGTQYMDPPDGGSVTPLEQVRRMVADYRERIEELESRTVTLPEPFKLAKSSSGLTYYYADEVDAAIQAAGIGVKGE